MSTVWESIRAVSKQKEAEFDVIHSSLESSYLRTTELMLIKNNKITLPSVSVGDVVFNIAKIFYKKDEFEYDDYTCKINTENYKEVLFEDTDELNGYYAVVSYLTYKDDI